MKSYVDNGELSTFYWRNNFNEVTDISTEYRTCGKATETPSSVPTFITASPSLSRTPDTVAIQFIIEITGPKSAAELSKCCRNQILISARKSINQVLKALTGRNLRRLLTKEININSAVHNEISTTHRKTREEGDIQCSVNSIKDNSGECSLL